MIGRKLANAGSDRELKDLFKKTWMVSEDKLRKKLSTKVVTEYKQKFDKWFENKLEWWT